MITIILKSQHQCGIWLDGVLRRSKWIFIHIWWILFIGKIKFQKNLEIFQSQRKMKWWWWWKKNKGNGSDEYTFRPILYGIERIIPRILRLFGKGETSILPRSAMRWIGGEEGTTSLPQAPWLADAVIRGATEAFDRRRWDLWPAATIATAVAAGEASDEFRKRRRCALLLLRKVLRAEAAVGAPPSPPSDRVDYERYDTLHSHPLSPSLLFFASLFNEDCSSDISLSPSSTGIKRHITPVTTRYSVREREDIYIWAYDDEVSGRDRIDIFLFLSVYMKFPIWIGLGPYNEKRSICWV